MTRKPSKQPLAILMIILTIILLLAGAYFGLFAVFRPRPEPATWPKIVSLHIGQYYERYSVFGWPSDTLIGKVDGDYQILTYDKTEKGWKTLNPPSKKITRYAGGRPMPVNVKPSVWEYRESGDTVYFRIDPDEEDDGMPDLAISIKFVKNVAYPGYWGETTALYDVHVAVIGTSAREIPRLYKDTYFMVALDSWYLLTSITLNNERQETLVDDASGKVKIMIWVPEAVPEHEAGDVWFWEHLLNLPVDDKVYDEVKALAVGYNPQVVVTSAKTTYHYTAPTHTGPILTTYQTTGTELPTTTVHHTVLIPVTTTKTITTYEVVYQTTTVGGQTVVVTKSTTITRKATITGLKTTTKVLREGETVTIVITKTKATKIIEILEEIPSWVWIICILLFAGMLAAIGFNLTGRRGKPRSARRRRRSSRRR